MRHFDEACETGGRALANSLGGRFRAEAATSGQTTLLPRRTLLGSGAALLGAHAARALPVPRDNHLIFRITRHDTAIGTHDIEFTRDGDALTVRIAIDIVVSIGPIALFRYRHRATEHWQGEQLMRMDSETNDDGRQDRLHVTRRPDGLAVDSSRFPFYVAPPNALPGSHWNERMLTVPAINTQHGKLLLAKVTMLDEERVPLASGATVEARHFRVRGDANIDTWYDDAPSWVALRFIAHEGSEIRYERM
jgi:hypothetical protein